MLLLPLRNQSSSTTICRNGIFFVVTIGKAPVRSYSGLEAEGRERVGLRAVGEDGPGALDRARRDDRLEEVKVWFHGAPW